MTDVREPRAPRPLARDTDPWADRVLCEHWRSLDSVAKLRILSEQVGDLLRKASLGVDDGRVLPRHQASWGLR